jgi:peptidoglycan/xylan/chitin deacetylase (PgdA/CDA1 family)
MIYPLARNCLTVLAYHRIADLSSPDFIGLRSTVSASAEGFAKQCRFLRHWFNVISYEHLSHWLEGEESLPPWPALLTFDDGYRDNLTTALPILRQLNLPSLIFLTTTHLDDGRPFYWDQVAFCFQHAPLGDLSLPLLGRVFLTDPGREGLLMEWMAKSKNVMEDEKAEAVRQLPVAMGLDIPSQRFRELILTWDETKRLPPLGMALGAHTRSHPILSKLPYNKAIDEIAGSRADIEARTGQAVCSFAYPNGHRTDFSESLERGITELGLETAFTLITGASSLRKIRQRPTAIRRIMISHKDDLRRFAFKLMSGLPEFRDILHTIIDPHHNHDALPADSC